MEVGFELGGVSVASQLGRFAGPSQRARQHEGKTAPLESPTNRSGFLTSMRGQRQVRAAGVSAGEAPFRFAMTHQPELTRHYSDMMGSCCSRPPGCSCGFRISSRAQVFHRNSASSLAGGRIASAFSYQSMASRSQSWIAEAET